MKKMFLIAGILAAGFISANTKVETNEEFAISKNKNEIAIKSVEKDSQLNNQLVKALYPIYYTTSCGVAAVTNQTGWSEAQILGWAAALEENYC